MRDEITEVRLRWRHGRDSCGGKCAAGGRERKHAVRGRHVGHAPCAAVGTARGRHLHGSPCAAPVEVCGERTLCAGLSARCS